MIEKYLDSNGWAVMSEELRQIFLAAGCDPTCHTCDESIPVAKRFHLKEFFKQVYDDGQETTAQVMLCQKCSLAGKTISEWNADELAKLAGHDPDDPDGRMIEGVVDPPPPPTEPRRGCYLINGEIVTA